MTPNPSLHLHTALAQGLRTLFLRLEAWLSLQRPLNVYLAGGMAVHLYTGGRVTTDVDAEFDARIAIPNDLMVEVTLEDGREQVVYFDTHYNPKFSLLHEHYRNDAVPVDLGLDRLRVHLLSPVDLAVCKILHLNGNNRQDIALLVRLGLTNAGEIEQRAAQALATTLVAGDSTVVQQRLRDAIAWVATQRNA